MQLAVFHQNKDQLSVKGLKDLYINLINSAQNSYLELKKRKTGMNHLLNQIDLLQNDQEPDIAIKLFRLKTAVNMLSQTIVQTTVKDIELSTYKRDAQKLKILLKKHELKEEKYVKKVQMLQEKIFDMNFGT